MPHPLPKLLTQTYANTQIHAHPRFSVSTSPRQPARKRFDIRSQKPGANWLCDTHSNVYPKKQPLAARDCKGTKTSTSHVSGKTSLEGSEMDWMETILRIMGHKGCTPYGRRCGDRMSWYHQVTGAESPTTRDTWRTQDGEGDMWNKMGGGGSSLCCHLKAGNKNALTRDHKLGLARVSSGRGLHPAAETSSWRFSKHHPFILLTDYRSLLSLLHRELNPISFLLQYPHLQKSSVEPSLSF